MTVLFSPEVQKYYDELENILYEKGYFSYEYEAIEYVEDLIFDIKTKLPTKQHKPASPYYDRYGKGLCYATFTKNKRTSWYAFFSKYDVNGEIVYLVRYIGNNHTDAHHL